MLLDPPNPHDGVAIGAFKELIVAMLGEDRHSTDNDFDDQVVAFVKDLLFLTQGLKSRWCPASSKYLCCWCWACCHSCRFLNAFPKMRPISWLLLNNLRSPCRRNYWMSQRIGMRCGRQAGMTLRSTCLTSSSSTTRQERDTASASAQQLRWWQRFAEEGSYG